MTSPGVTVDKSGTLYGTNDQGGTEGWGAVYQIVPERGERVLAPNPSKGITDIE